MLRDRRTNIKVLLLRHGVTQAAIARTLKVSEAAVSRVISGKQRSRRIERAIARRIGKKRTDLWAA